MTIKTTPPSRTADQFVVRLPDGMRDRIAELAKQNNRSMNAEIVKRLEWALTLTGEPTFKPALPPVVGDIPYFMAQDIARLAHDAGVPFDEMLARIFMAGIHKDAPQVLYISLMPGATTKELRLALEASKDIARPDATFVSETIMKKQSLESTPSGSQGSAESEDPSPPALAPIASERIIKRGRKKTP